MIFERCSSDIHCRRIKRRIKRDYPNISSPADDDFLHHSSFIFSSGTDRILPAFVFNPIHE
jgi:hypothetical protein